jgi:hypothetical protein
MKECFREESHPSGAAMQITTIKALPSHYPAFGCSLNPKNLRSIAFGYRLYYDVLRDLKAVLKGFK